MMTNIEKHFGGDMGRVEEAIEQRGYGLALPLPDPRVTVMVFDGADFIDAAKTVLAGAAAKRWAQRRELAAWLHAPAEVLA